MQRIKCLCSCWFYFFLYLFDDIGQGALISYKEIKIEKKCYDLESREENKEEECNQRE